MGLSVCTITRNSAAHLPAWAARVREYADELVIVVDVSTEDDTYEVARGLADQVHAVELPGYVEPAKDWAMRRATGDWVMLVDDDEYVSRRLAARMPDLLADRRYTHYHVPVRWVVEADDGGLAWLRQHPWYSWGWCRLVRNIAGLWHLGIVVHSNLRVHGEGCALDPDSGEAVYHMDLLWNDRTAREAKGRLYDALAIEHPSAAEYYRYEDYATTLALAPVPPEEADLPRTRVGATPSPLPRPGVLVTGFASGPARPPLVVPDRALEAHCADVGPDPPIWSAEYVAHETPAELLTARGYAVPVTLRNTSAATWRNVGTPDGRVVLSFRWFAEGWGAEIPLGDVTVLPHAIAPGEEVRVLAGLWTPPEPGRYTLRWELLCERVGWFSERGVDPLSVEVDVRDDGPRPQSSHFPRRAATPAAPGGEEAGALVPHGPIRVLDTRDGTGVTGAVLGPVPADATVVLTLGGEAGIPADAAAVVATASVLEPDYGGFLTAFATDGTKGEAFPSVTFLRSATTSSLVFAALGRDRGDARLSLHLSPGPDGACAHLLLDVTAYTRA